jgi:hypothetical protein
MAKHITLDELNAWTFDQRQTFYRNGLARFDNADSVRLVEMIVTSGLPFRHGKDIAHGDREMKALEAIVYSPYNEKLLLEAAASGKPPLGAIEPLMIEGLGEDYRIDNGATHRCRIPDRAPPLCPRLRKGQQPENAGWQRCQDCRDVP